MGKIDFSKLKANRSNMASQLRNQIESINKGGFKDDERFWKPKTDKSGQGYHIIRFLPSQHNEDMAFAHLIKYNVYGKSGTYWENSMATFDDVLDVGQFHPDPAREEKNRLFALKTKAGDEAGKKIKRQEEFYANILVKSDSEDSNNNGKVFLYKFGKQIFNIIQKGFKPEKKFGETEVKDVFDIFDGHDFEMIITSKEIPDNKDPSKMVLVPTYEASKIGDKCVALEDEKAMETAFEATHDISTFVERDKFKSYEELSKKFNRVMGIDGTVGTGNKTAGDLMKEQEDSVTPTTDEAESTMENLDKQQEADLDEVMTADSEPEAKEEPKEEVKATASTDAEDFFQNLANNS